LVFAPSLEEMYPGGPSSAFVEVPRSPIGSKGRADPAIFGCRHGRAQALEHRWPDLAFFGMKDYQQLQVIRRMVTDLDILSRSAPWRRFAKPMAWP